MKNTQPLSREEILKRAIEKAVKNGYSNEEYELMVKVYGYSYLCNRPVPNSLPFYTSIIFSHDFAKAFWGDGIYYSCNDCNKICGKRPSGTSDCCHEIVTEKIIWQYHLQQMVLEPDPLQYLSQFI